MHEYTPKGLLDYLCAIQVLAALTSAKKCWLVANFGREHENSKWVAIQLLH